MKALRTIILAAALTAGAIGVTAKGPVATFRTTMHDFGAIQARDGKVKCTYTVVNTGDEPLAITHVTNGGCGCTKPDYTKKPIAPGDSGVVTVTFDPIQFRGEVSRTIRVTANTKPKGTKLTFRADIIPVNP